MIWVLARALCHFKSIDLSHVPERARSQALVLQLTQISPYRVTGHHAVWQDGQAMLWYWDDERRQRGMLEAMVSAPRVSVVPEPVFYPPVSDGLRLLACLSGVEGQYWQNGRLLGSRWWDAAPDAVEWLSFQRGLGLGAEQRDLTVPDAQRLELRPEQPFLSAATAGAASWRNERVAYALLVVLLCMPTAWFAAGTLKTQLALNAAHAHNSEIAHQAQPLLAAREEATRIATHLRRLAALSPFPDQPELMSRVAHALPKGAVYLKEWDFHDDQLKLVLVLINPAVSSSELVGDLQKVNGIDNVQAAPSNDPKVLILTMQIARLVPSDHV